MGRYAIKLNSKLIATNWWSQKWCNNIVQYADCCNRLERGRLYLRAGRVSNLFVEGGKVVAWVVGSRENPYKVVINIKSLSRNKKREILKNLKKINIKEFQQGNVSTEEGYLFSSDKNGLFPKVNDVRLFCSCPDCAVLCKHCVAVLYAIGTILDKEPLFLFRLRGIDIDKYLEKSLQKNANDLLSNIKVKKIIDENMILDIFGIEISSLSNSSSNKRFGEKIGYIDNNKEEDELQKIFYRNQGACQYCGGSFKRKNIFSSTNICSYCGIKKDY